MPNDIVLILTQSIDAHADLVINQLNNRGIELIRFDTSDFPLRSTLTARNNSKSWSGGIQFQDRYIPFNHIKSIWFRRPTPFEFDAILTPTEHQFASGEARMAIGGILRGIPCLWVNHPEKIVSADYKPTQLSLARDCGLETPPTLITNSLDEASAFFDECKGEMIYKTLSGGMIIERGMIHSIFTSRVTANDLQDAGRVIQNTACLFQKNIPKKLELRITIMGNHVFAAEIHSQGSEKSSIDFRASYEDLSYDIYYLPDEVRDACLALMRRLGLVFAAIDMILTPDGDYIFLELNANGQWSWIEAATSLPLSETFAKLLSNGY